MRGYVAHVRKDGNLRLAYAPADGAEFVEETDPGVYEVVAYDVMGRSLGSRTVTVEPRATGVAEFHLEL